MPAKSREKPIYQRGSYRLDRRADRGNLVITWYDPERRRERSVSAGTADVDGAKRELDRRYNEATGGSVICPTCGQVRNGAQGALVLDAISDYQIDVGDKRETAKAIANRLAHVVTYVAQSANPGVRCDQIDDHWVENFRSWALKQPVISPKGKTRDRSHATVEASVAMLAASINYAFSRGNCLRKARFKVLQPKDVNESPQFRADVKTIAAAFSHCLNPKREEGMTDRQYAAICRSRSNLLAFLRLSIATLARPDAVHDFNTDPKFGQWHPNRHVINLNPKGRRQTRKYRATLPAVRQIVPVLNACEGQLVTAASVRKAHEALIDALGLTLNGEAGMKLWRRSMATLLRARMAKRDWPEISMFLGHDKFDQTSDIYAPFDPDYLGAAKAEIEAIIDEIEQICSGAFYRIDTAQASPAPKLRIVKNG